MSKETFQRIILFWLAVQDGRAKAACAAFFPAVDGQLYRREISPRG